MTSAPEVGVGFGIGPGPPVVVPDEPLQPASTIAASWHVIGSNEYNRGMNDSFTSNLEAGRIVFHLWKWAFSANANNSLCNSSIMARSGAARNRENTGH